MANEEETIFHKIIRREIPADIVFEDDQVIAFKDISPVSPVHILVVPKHTLPSIAAAQASDREVLGHMLLVCRDIAQEQGIAEDGYRIVINTGDNGAQTVFQLHMHLLGGRYHSWPPG